MEKYAGHENRWHQGRPSLQAAFLKIGSGQKTLRQSSDPGPVGRGNLFLPQSFPRAPAPPSIVRITQRDARAGTPRFRSGDKPLGKKHLRRICLRASKPRVPPGIKPARNKKHILPNLETAGLARVTEAPPPGAWLPGRDPSVRFAFAHDLLCSLPAPAGKS